MKLLVRFEPVPILEVPLELRVVNDPVEPEIGVPAIVLPFVPVIVKFDPVTPFVPKLTLPPATVSPLLAVSSPSAVIVPLDVV